MCHKCSQAPWHSCQCTQPCRWLVLTHCRNCGFAQELTGAEGIFSDICNEIEKAEKFFPVPETAQAYLDATAAAAAGRGKTSHFLASCLHAERADVIGVR
jgi:hypothetical protein